MHELFKAILTRKNMMIRFCCIAFFCSICFNCDSQKEIARIVIKSIPFYSTTSYPLKPDIFKYMNSGRKGECIKAIYNKAETERIYHAMERFTNHSETKPFRLDDVDIRAEITLILKNKRQEKYYVDGDKTILFENMRYINSDSSNFLEIFNTIECSISP